MNLSTVVALRTTLKKFHSTQKDLKYTLPIIWFCIYSICCTEPQSNVFLALVVFCISLHKYNSIYFIMLIFNLIKHYVEYKEFVAHERKDVEYV